MIDVSEIVLAIMEKENQRRESIALDFLLSGAFVNELCAVQIVLQPESWRIQ